MIAHTETRSIPAWLDERTRALIADVTRTLVERHGDRLIAVILYGSIARHDERPLSDPEPSDVDLLAVCDADKRRVRALEENMRASLRAPWDRHLDAPREVNVMVASRTLHEWAPCFALNVARDGVALYARGPLPPPLRPRARRLSEKGRARLADSHRQAAENNEATIVHIQAIPYASRIVIEAAWGAGLHWIAYGCQRKYQRHRDKHQGLVAYLKGLNEPDVADWWNELEHVRQGGWYGTVTGPIPAQSALDLLAKIRAWATS